MDQRQAQVDIDRLSDSDKRDLQQSINNEMQKAKIQECTRYIFPVPISSKLSYQPPAANCFPESPMSTLTDATPAAL